MARAIGTITVKINSGRAQKGRLEAKANDQTF
jgi:hypothetical protein